MNPEPADDLRFVVDVKLLGGIAPSAVVIQRIHAQIFTAFRLGTIAEAVTIRDPEARA